MTAQDRRAPRVLWASRKGRVVYAPGHDRGAIVCEVRGTDALGAETWVRTDADHERISILEDALIAVTQETKRG